MSVPAGPPPMQYPQPPGPPFPAAGAPPKFVISANTAAMMLCGAAVLILVGLLSKSWITYSGGAGEARIHIAPLGAETCVASGCEGMPLPATMPGDFTLLRILALISGFASIAGAVMYGAMTLAGVREKIPLAPRLGQLVFAAAAFSFVFFVVRVFSEGGSGIGPGWAAFPGVGGAVLASFGIKKLTPFLMMPIAPQPQLAGGYGQPPYGQPLYGQPPYGQPPHGQPPYGQPQGPYPHPQGGFAPPGSPSFAPPQPHGFAPPQQQGFAPAQPGLPPQQQGLAPPQAQGYPPQQQQQGGYAPPHGYAPPQGYGSTPSGYGPPPHGYAHGQTPQRQQDDEDPEPPRGPRLQPPAPTCPRCGKPGSKFDEQYFRWFCERDGVYL